MHRQQDRPLLDAGAVYICPDVVPAVTATSQSSPDLVFPSCVVQAGVAMKPNSVFLHIMYSNFLIDVRHNIQLGWSHLEQAKKLEPNLSYQFSIFTRNQEHKQKAAGGGGGAGNEGSVDLVSYVEFQKNYR